mgnify:CR=1 FL=1
MPDRHYYKNCLKVQKKMKLIDFIKDGGLCKSKSGHWFRLSGFQSGNYPISGFLQINDRWYEYQWSEDGVPINLPYTHGLDLMPLVEEISYKMVNKNILEECENINQFKDLAVNS